VYDNLEPLIALAAAAACTSRIRLISTVVNVNWRANPRLLAKQISSVVRVSGGRFTAGLGMGGWPADYEASDITPNGQGKRFAAALTVMDQARSDTLTSAEGMRAELARLAGAGCTDVVLYPCSGDLDQVERLSQALRSAVTVPDA
jgi:alkanesulfonate monooxygenase SsuD/methylene tetrahydromethanopterin reductase-like flavin-dependent oxidoreductase (luciferase family)